MLNCYVSWNKIFKHWRFVKWIETINHSLKLLRFPAAQPKRQIISRSPWWTCRRVHWFRGYSKLLEVFIQLSVGKNAIWLLSHFDRHYVGLKSQNSFSNHCFGSMFSQHSTPSFFLLFSTCQVKHDKNSNIENSCLFGWFKSLLSLFSLDGYFPFVSFGWLSGYG